MRSAMRFFAVFVVAAGLLVGCKSTPQKKNEKQHVTEKTAPKPKFSAQELFVQGNKALDAKDFDKAVTLYDQALSQDDARWDIYMNKAIALSAQQHFSKAIDAIDKSLAHGGDKHPEVYFNLGNIYQNRALYSQSIKAYRTSLALRQKPDIDTLVNIAGALMLMRQYDKARAAYEHLRTLAPDDPRVYLGLGLAEQMLTHFKDALQYYEQVNSMKPDFAQAWYNKANLLQSIGKRKEAIASYEQYLKVAPDGPVAKRARNRMNALKKKK